MNVIDELPSQSNSPEKSTEALESGEISALSTQLKRVVREGSLDLRRP